MPPKLPERHFVDNFSTAIFLPPTARSAAAPVMPPQPMESATSFPIKGFRESADVELGGMGQIEIAGDSPHRALGSGWVVCPGAKVCYHDAQEH